MSEVNLSENLFDQTRKETNEIFSDLVNGRYDENDSDNQSTQTNSELQENRPKNNLIYNYLLPGKEKSYHIDSNNFVRKEEWTKKTVPLFQRKLKTQMKTLLRIITIIIPKL